MTRFLDFKTLTRSPKPNTALVAPPGLCAQAETDRDAPVFDAEPIDIFESLVTQLADMPGVRDLETDPAAFCIRCVAVTPLLRFKDDVDIRVLPASDGDGATVAIYSRSRVGYSDLGANLKRIDHLLGNLSAN